MLKFEFSGCIPDPNRYKNINRIAHLWNGNGMATQAKAMENSKQVRFIAHLICRFISLSPHMISSTPNHGAQPTANILPDFKSGYLIGDIESLTPNKRKTYRTDPPPNHPRVRVQCHYVHTDSRRRSRRVTTPRGRSRQSAQLQSWAPLAQRCHGRAPMNSHQHS